jgi:hypothetical protein
LRQRGLNPTSIYYVFEPSDFGRRMMRKVMMEEPYFRVQAMITSDTFDCFG